VKKSVDPNAERTVPAIAYERGAPYARSADLRDRRREERDERERQDRRQRRIDDAISAVPTREQLVQPRRRFGQPPSAMEKRVRQATVIVVVGGEPRASGHIDPRRDHSDPDRGCSVRHGHSLSTR
jgi:hypothetical protein